MLGTVCKKKNTSKRSREVWEEVSNKHWSSVSSSVADPDPYVFGPSGSASGSVVTSWLRMLTSSSEKKVRKTLISIVLWLLMIFYLWRKCKRRYQCSGSVYVFGPPGSASGSSQRYVSEHTEPYQNVTDPQTGFQDVRTLIHKKYKRTALPFTKM